MVSKNKKQKTLSGLEDLIFNESMNSIKKNLGDIVETPLLKRLDSYNNSAQALIHLALTFRDELKSMSASAQKKITRYVLGYFINANLLANGNPHEPDDPLKKAGDLKNYLRGSLKIFSNSRSEVNELMFYEDPFKANNEYSLLYEVVRKIPSFMLEEKFIKDFYKESLFPGKKRLTAGERAEVDKFSSAVLSNIDKIRDPDSNFSRQAKNFKIDIMVYSLKESYWRNPNLPFFIFLKKGKVADSIIGKAGDYISKSLKSLPKDYSSIDRLTSHHVLAAYRKIATNLGESSVNSEFESLISSFFSEVDPADLTLYYRLLNYDSIKDFFDKESAFLKSGKRTYSKKVLVRHGLIKQMFFSDSSSSSLSDDQIKEIASFLNDYSKSPRNGSKKIKTSKFSNYHSAISSLEKKFLSSIDQYIGALRKDDKNFDKKLLRYVIYPLLGDVQDLRGIKIIKNPFSLLDKPVPVGSKYVLNYDPALVEGDCINLISKFRDYYIPNTFESVKSKTGLYSTVHAKFNSWLGGDRVEFQFGDFLSLLEDYFGLSNHVLYKQQKARNKVNLSSSQKSFKYSFSKEVGGFISVLDSYVGLAMSDYFVQNSSGGVDSLVEKFLSELNGSLSR